MNNIGLVCEGGGLRCLYTSGVLDFFLDQGLEFNYVIGVSAGAIYSPSYISKQKQRMFNIQKKYINDKRYMGIRHLLSTGNYINNKFTYHKMTKELSPFAYDVFINSKTTFKAGAFNCKTGKTDFFSKDEFPHIDGFLEVLIASGSLPFLSKESILNNIPYLDGGIGCPIPINKSIQDGNIKNIVILTQTMEYEKSPLKYKRFTHLFYRKFPAVAKALLNRHNVYNDTIKELKTLEKEDKVYIIRPQKKVEVSRLEKNTSKLADLYECGYTDAKKQYADILHWINKK